MNLKPYPEYKDSGVAWLGKVPGHWEIKRNGRLFAQRNQTGFPDLPILEVSLKTGVRIRDFVNSKRKQIMEDHSKYKKAERGDIAYNMMRMWQGAVGVAPVNGLVSPAYVIAKPYHETESRYYGYLFRTSAYMSEVNNYSRGIVSDRNRLYWDEFKMIPSPQPPFQEQLKIVNYLRYKTAQISRFIKAKKRLIELLKEQKQVIINDAVTGKIDVATGKPYPKYKDSGVEWLGQVPEGWEVRRLKTILKNGLRNGIFKKKDSFGSGTCLVNVSDIYSHDLHIDISKLERVEISDEEKKLFKVTDGDIFFVRSSLKLEGTGQSALIKGVYDDIVFECHVVKCSPKNFIIHDELILYLNSTPIKNWIVSRANTVTMSTISQGSILNIPILLCSLDDQNKILNYIQKQTQVIDCIISRTEREVALIQEFRTRLISDVVTGKIDVRDIEILDIPEADEIIDELPEEPEEGEGMEEDNDFPRK